LPALQFIAGNKGEQMPKARKPKQKAEDAATRLQRARYAITEAQRRLAPTLLGGLMNAIKVEECDGLNPLPSIGAADPANDRLYVNPWFVGQKGRAPEADEWVHVLGHLALHLGLNHAARREDRDPLLWTLACDVVADRLLDAFGIGRRPLALGETFWRGDEPEETIYEELLRQRELDRRLVPTYTLAGEGRPDILGLGRLPPWRADYEARLAAGIQMAVQETVAQTADHLLEERTTLQARRWAPAERAKQWVLSEFPLLGALAGEIRIIADAELCERMDIPIAAVNGFLGEMYLHPACGFTPEEMIFVYVHELLHVALFHHQRGLGRDPYIYNLAADFVINGWLVEMGVGALPKIGALYDPRLAGMSTEEVYDLLLLNPRERKGLRGFSGSRGDILQEAPNGRQIYRGDVTTVDDIYRRCLREGYSCQSCHGRGFVPAGLLEEIQSLWTAPVPWDVELAQWMDRHVPIPKDWRRSYGRASRRQASTPEIPRPARYLPLEEIAACTFGVILDTSGSMDRNLLGRALGAIASYAESRDVPAIRLILCDAAPYDRGYLPPTDLRGSVCIQGRGGTVLQPAVAHLLRQPDFPATAPVMILTDGWCEEEILCAREHCFILPRKSWKEGALSLRTSAPIFRVLKEAHEWDG